MGHAAGLGKTKSYRRRHRHAHNYNWIVEKKDYLHFVIIELGLQAPMIRSSPYSLCQALIFAVCTSFP